MKITKQFAIALLACLPIFGAGSVNQTIGPLGPPPASGPDTRIYLLQLLWTGDSVTGTVPATPINISQFPQLQGMRVVSFEVQPSTPAPTSNYSLTLVDSNGVDMFGGAAVNLSSTVATSNSTVLSPPLVATPTFNVSGNSVASARGQVSIYFAQQSQVQATQGAAGLAAGNTFTGANTFTGTTTITQAKQINNKLWASQFPGVDCGAKAVAAFAQAGGPFEVEIDQLCAVGGNLGTTQIVVPAGNGLAFDQPGSYTTSNAQVQAIFINAGGYLDCRSRGAVTITETQANTSLVTILSNTEVRNCDLHGTGTAGTASAINSGSASNVYIHDNILESMGANGINTGANPTEWRVENNLIRNNLSEGFLCAPSCQQSYIAYNHFTGNTSNGFDLNGATNRVIGNEADHNGGSGASGLDKDGMISFASGATSNSLNNIWIGNFSHDNNSHGFRFQSGTGGTTQGNVYIGNRATGNGTGTTPCGSGFVLRNDTTNGIVTENTFIGNSSRGNLGSGAGCADGFALISSGGAGAFNTNQIIGGEMQSNANWGIEIINSNAVDTDVRDAVLIANTTGTFTDGGVRTRIRGIKNQQTDSEDPVNTGTFAIAGPTSTLKTLRIYGFNNIDDQVNFHAIFSDNGANSTIDIQPIGGKFFKFDGVSGLGRGVTWIGDQGTACTNGELVLSAGWQSTGAATVTAVVGTGQTCSWTITTGTTTAANPTVTDNLTNALLATVVCEMNIHGGTHTAAAGEGFQQTTLSATAPVFTFNGTPTAGGTTYFVTRRCGP